MHTHLNFWTFWSGWAVWVWAAKIWNRNGEQKWKCALETWWLPHERGVKQGKWNWPLELHRPLFLSTNKKEMQCCMCSWHRLHLPLHSFRNVETALASLGLVALVLLLSWHWATEHSGECRQNENNINEWKSNSKKIHFPRLTFMCFFCCCCCVFILAHSMCPGRLSLRHLHWQRRRRLRTQFCFSFNSNFLSANIFLVLFRIIIIMHFSV